MHEKYISLQKRLVVIETPGAIMSALYQSYSNDEVLLEEARKTCKIYNSGSVTCTKNDEIGIAEICIENKFKKNAISGKMMIDLENIVDDLEKWSAGKGIIIRGAGDAFCSGGDLELVASEGNSKSGYLLSFYMGRTLNRLLNLPFISVAYIDGLALGGGAEISTAADFRLVLNSESVKIGFVHNIMGITPAWGSAARLVSLIGKSKALDLVLSAKLLNCEEAVKIGFANDAVDSFEAAKQWLLKRTRHSTDVIRGTKLAFQAACGIPKDVISQELNISSRLWGGPAQKEALNNKIKHK